MTNDAIAIKARKALELLQLLNAGVISMTTFMEATTPESKRGGFGSMLKAVR